MALLTYQNFQAFPDGDTGPWGDLTGVAGAAISDTAAPDGSVGPYGETVFLDGRCKFNDGAFRADMTALFAFRAPLLPDLGNLIEFIDPSVGAEVLFGLRMLPDSTLAPVFEASVIAPACDFIFSTDNWNYLQVNISITDGVAGSLHLVWEVACDGKSISTGTYNTRAVGPLRIGEVRFLGSVPAMITGHLGEVSLYSTIQSVPTFPHPGTSIAHSTNEVIELILVPGTSPPISVACPTGTGFVGVAYSSFALGTGGTPPYTWAITAGSLPPGLSLNPVTGEVAGTPTTNGVYAYTITIYDSLGASSPSDCQITITTVSIPTLACPIGVGTVGTPYSSTAVASGGNPPYTWSITSGSLPPGLTLNASNGLVSGTPTTPGVYVYHIHIVDSLGAPADSDCQIIIAGIFPPPEPIPGDTCTERTPPILYAWEPSYLDRPEDIAMRASDWEDAGVIGAKFVQGFTLQADTMGQNKSLSIEGDQAAMETFIINHNGEQVKPYVFTPARIASLLRFISTDDTPWRFFAIRYIWEPLPELVTYYETQGTTHDIPGYQFLKDGYISLISSATVTLTVNVDGVDYVYTIPSTGGAHAKVYMIFGINPTTGRTLKGKEYKYTLSSSAGFRLYQKDCEVRVHAWSGGDYQVKMPFGDASRIYGARI